MSSQIKFYKHQHSENDRAKDYKKVELTALLSRVSQEKKKERNSNIALSVAAVSAVTVFGIILSL